MFIQKMSKNIYQGKKIDYTIFIRMLNKIVKYSIWKDEFILPQPLYTFMLLSWEVEIC